MGHMPVMPRGGEWTVDDLVALPDDGLQYELAEGMLLVTPAPRLLHQRVLRKLSRVVEAATPSGCEVFFAPVDFQPDRRTSVQPDLLVVRNQDVRERSVTAPPLLAVEVLSPSTRSKDLLLKRGIYERAGVGSYWVIDPDEPSLRAWDLMDGEYVEAAHALGDAVALLARPFAITVVPRSLVT